MQIYNIWKDDDPNDSFSVVAPDASAAAFYALQELGWCFGVGQETDIKEEGVVLED